MALTVSRRAQEIQPSATLTINKKARELKSKGIDIINLSVGEPDFDTPEPIKEAAVSSLKEGFTKYTDSSGIQELRAAICEKLRSENNLAFSPEQIVVSNGAKHSLFNIFLALLDPGDEVIIPAPYWVSYPEMVRIAGGQPVFCRWNERFKTDLEHLKKLISSRTKALVLNSPCNPTGIVYHKNELEELAEVILKHDIVCISDEIYEKIIYDNIAHVSIGSLSEEIKKQTIIVNGVSKTFAMTGWRIGYIAAPKDIAGAIANIQSQTASNPVSFCQKATLHGIEHGQNLYQKMVEEFGRRRDFIIENLPDKIKYPRPEGAFYFFLKMGTCKSEELARKLLEEYHLAVVPGKDFGADDYIRISFATSMQNLEKAVERMQKFVRENP